MMCLRQIINHGLVGALAALFAGRTAVAQAAGVRKFELTAEELQILRVTPSDTTMTSSLVTVTFNHPVIMAIARSPIEPARVMSLEPNVAGTFEWSDASTLRFIPAEPFVPGTKLVVTLDTAAIASSGARTGERYRVPVVFGGARPLAMLIEEHPANADWPTGPLPHFRVLYSTIVDLDSVAQHSKLVFPGGCGGPIALRAVRQRTVIIGEGAAIENAGGPYRDSVPDRFRRVVELEPTDSLRPNCLGMWQVASFDPSRPRDGWVFGIRTAPPFTVKSIDPCLIEAHTASSCAPNGLSIVFSANVARDEFVKHVKVSPAVATVAASLPPTTIFQLAAPLTPGKRYSVTIDGTLHDVYGRALTGPYTFTVIAGARVTH
jgi:hypothetical protein